MRGLILAAALGAWPAMAGTQVCGQMVAPNGRVATGSLTIEPSAPFTTPAGTTVAKTQTTVRLASGRFCVVLEPNDTGTPAGTRYTVTWNLDGSRPVAQQWSVATSAATLALTDVVVTTPATQGTYLPSGSGVVKVTNGASGLVSGTATDCVLVNGQSGPCGTAEAAPAAMVPDATGTITINSSVSPPEIGVTDNMFASILEMQAGNGTKCIAASGSGTGYACSHSPAYIALSNGAAMGFVPDVDSTGNVTLDVDGLGAKTVLLTDAATQAGAGNLVAGRPVYLVYATGLDSGNGAWWIVGGPKGDAGTPGAKGDKGDQGDPGSSSASTMYLVFDGSTTNPGDGSTLSWSCTPATDNAPHCDTTWTVPAGVSSVEVTGWSGGGPGGFGRGGSTTYPGGGGGGYVKATCAVTPGGTLSIVLGMGGVSPAGRLTQINGGTTTVGSCFSIIGGHGNSNGGSDVAASWGGYLSGSQARIGWLRSTTFTAFRDPGNTCAATAAEAGPSPVRIDGGGCGGGPVSTQPAAGVAGGSAIGGGGGGGGGAYNSDTYGSGGTSGLGGAGGHGGGHTAGTGRTNCTAGSVPGGGGGAAGASFGAGDEPGCSGARGEVRISYAK